MHRSWAAVQLASQRLLWIFSYMARRARLAIAITLIIAGFAVIGRAASWIAIPMLVIAIFFIFWGMEQRATEEFIRSVPMGSYLIRALDYIDAVLVARDREYDQHIKAIISSYDGELRSALRTLYRTRNTNLVAQYESRFVADGLIEYPKNGPGFIKPEIRDVVGRTLDRMGA